MTHFLQSAAWAAFQQSLGRTVITDSGDGWRYQAIIEKGRFNTRLYCPYGPEVDSPEAFEAALLSLKQHGKQQGVTFIRLEPTGRVSKNTMQQQGLSQQTLVHLQPQDTQVIDLTQSEADIIASMSQNTRNVYRNIHKKGVTIEMSHDPADIGAFTSLLHRVADRNGITPHSDKYFTAQAEVLFPLGAATLYQAKLDGQVIAAAIAYDSDTTRYYAHAAANDELRRLSAGTALLGRMIIDAKKAGLFTFDLYGIAPSDDTSHPWAGFTKFKQSFGGTKKQYVGLWEYPLKRWNYSIYRLLQLLTHRRR